MCAWCKTRMDWTNKDIETLQGLYLSIILKYFLWYVEILQGLVKTGKCEIVKQERWKHQLAWSCETHIFKSAWSGKKTYSTSSYALLLFKIRTRSTVQLSGSTMRTPTPEESSISFAVWLAGTSAPQIWKGSEKIKQIAGKVNGLGEYSSAMLFDLRLRYAMIMRKIDRMVYDVAVNNIWPKGSRTTSTDQQHRSCLSRLRRRLLTEPTPLPSTTPGATSECLSL